MLKATGEGDEAGVLSLLLLLLLLRRCSSRWQGSLFFTVGLFLLFFIVVLPVLLDIFDFSSLLRVFPLLLYFCGWEVYLKYRAVTWFTLRDVVTM